jgi:hypothetical protein
MLKDKHKTLDAVQNSNKDVNLICIDFVNPVTSEKNQIIFFGLVAFKTIGLSF